MSESKAREKVFLKKKEYEVNLEQIYKEFMHHFQSYLPKNIEAYDLSSFEMEVERLHTWISPKIIEILETAKQYDLKCIIISDTYFPIEHLKGILGKSASFFEKIYISNEYGVGKGNGLFQIVINSLEIEPGEILHVGDNWEADVAGAEKWGINSLLVPNGNTYLWGIIEKELEVSENLKSSTLSESKKTLHIGRTASARTANMIETSSGSEFSYRLFGQAVVGPILLAYTEWLIDNIKNPEDTIVFGMLREGGFLANLLERRLNKYDALRKLTITDLATSRRSTTFIDMPSEPTLEDILNTLPGRDSFSFRAFIQGFGLIPEDIPESLRVENASQKCEATLKMVQHIVGNKKTYTKLCRYVEMEKREFFNYMRNKLEDFPTQRQVILIDLGWGASIQKRLVKCDAFGDRDVLGLYLALHDGAFDHKDCDMKCAGFISDGIGGKSVVPLVLKYVEILEQVCTPNIGSTRNYRNGQPVYQPTTIPQEQQNKIHDVQLGIYDYFASTGIQICPIAAKEHAWNVLLRLSLKPNEEELIAFSSWIHDNSHANTTEMLSPEELKRAHEYMTPKQIFDGDFSHCYWPLGYGSSIIEEVLQSTTHIYSPNDLGIFQNNAEVSIKLFGQPGVRNISIHESHSVNCNLKSRFLHKCPIDQKYEEMEFNLSSWAHGFSIDFATVIYFKNGVKNYKEFNYSDFDKIWLLEPKNVTCEDFQQLNFSLDLSRLKADKILSVWLGGQVNQYTSTAALESRRFIKPSTEETSLRFHIDSMGLNHSAMMIDKKEDGVLLDFSGWAFFSDTCKAPDSISLLLWENGSWLGRWKTFQHERHDVSDALKLTDIPQVERRQFYVAAVLRTDQASRPRQTAVRASDARAE
ncbi:MAG: HAD-IA family hydrolase [Flavobacteriaceae bacterium]|nr:HAD-IA family hydrolase [Flavobacteriaceae bacterium]